MVQIIQIEVPSSLAKKTCEWQRIVPRGNGEKDCNIYIILKNQEYFYFGILNKISDKWNSF